MLLVNFVLYIYRTKLIVRVGFELGTPTPEVQRLNDCSGDHYGNASLKIRVCVLLYYSLRVLYSLYSPPSPARHLNVAPVLQRERSRAGLGPRPVPPVNDQSIYPLHERLRSL